MENANNNSINETAAALAAAISAAAAGGAVNAAEVEKIAGDVMTRKFAAVLPGILSEMDKRAEAAATAAAVGNVKRLEVSRGDSAPAVPLGVQHCNFEKLWRLANVRAAGGNHLNIYLYGPAGTGKTTAAISVARGLYGDDWESKFHAIGAISAPYELIGFRDAGGVYHETEFYKAYKNGGVFLFDELDSSSSSAVLAFNKALANGHMVFEGETVKRHPDCVIIAGGNTCMRGDGAAAGFQRVRHDAAFRDRFVFLDWPVDENLERTLAEAYGDDGSKWCAAVQDMRKSAAAAGIKDFEITPRATFNGCAMLAAGVPWSDVLDSCVRKGLNDSAWDKVMGGAE